MADVMAMAFCSGKLPAHADFIRFNAASREALAFDDWLHHGLHFVRTQLGVSWERTFSQSPQYQFVFHPENSDRFLSGLLMASQDKSQRRYPFLVSLLMDRRRFLDNQVFLAPVLLSSFFERAAQFVLRAMNGMEMRDIADQTQALSVSSLDQGSSEQQFRSEYLEVVTAREFWASVFGSFDDPRKFLVLKNLVDVLLPVRRRTPFRLNLGLRFPLSRDLRKRKFEVCLWHQVCLSMLGASPGVPFLFWTLPRDGGEGHLFLFFRQPPPRFFLQLLSPGVENETICIVDEEGAENVATAGQTLTQGYRALIESGDVTLSQFLQGLNQVSDRAEENYGR